MKIVFFQPPYLGKFGILRDHAGKFGIRVTHKTVLPPLDFAYAASVLEKNGYRYEIIDAPALNLGVQEILKNLSGSEPDLIVMNISAVSLIEDLKIAELVKKTTPKSKLCVTGSLFSVMPDLALNSSNVDVVIRNEIEYTVLDLARAIADEPLDDVMGIAFKKNGKIVKNPDRPLVLNLDELPFPAYHRLPVNRYSFGSFREKPFMTMLTSRGCPFGCIYCPYPIGFGNLWRGRSAGNVLAEIQFLVEKFHVRSILFRDQVFTFDMKRTEEICRGIIEREMDINWRCETRIDRLSKKLMSTMKKAGCVGLHLGVESGDPEILTKVAKKGLKINMIRKVFADAKDLGIETLAFFMVGLPGETKRSVWKSFQLAMEIDPDFIQFGVVTPYPGTELYRLAEDKGWILTKDWSRYTGFDVVMRTDDLSEDDINLAIKYLKTCTQYRKKKLETQVFSRKGALDACLNPVKAVKWIFNAAKYYFTDVEKRFKQWALED